MGKSEQAIQNDLYSKKTKIGEKYTCESLGATTVASLIGEGRIANRQVTAEIGRKKPDVLVLNEAKDVVIYMELKKPSTLKTKADIQKAIEQELPVAQALHSMVYLVTDGEKYIWINPKTGNKILDEEGKPVTLAVVPTKNDKEVCEMLLKIKRSISSKNDNILAKQELDPTDLAVRINKILVNLTFASSKMSLYTFVEIFVFKYLTDIGVMRKDLGFDKIAEMYTPEYRLAHEEVKDDAYVLGYYMDNSREFMKKLFPPSTIDGTSIINGKVFHVSKDYYGEYMSDDNTDYIFRKVIEEFVAYEKDNGKFLDISNDFKSKLFETFMKNSADTSNMGQFFTPLKVVDSMVEMVDIKPGDVVCDPTCGVGKFLMGAVSNHIDDWYRYENGKLHKEVELVGFDKMMSDKDDLTIVLAKANTLIYFADLFRKHPDRKDVVNITNSLMNETFTLYKSMLGTLGVLEENKYDVILANPPYYSNASLQDDAKATGNYTYGGHGLEGLFLEWIMKSLKPGGVANIVLPDGIFSNYANKGLKEALLRDFYIESLISLPNSTFFNTPKKTYILTIKKKINQAEIQTKPVFTYIATSVGESLDKYRFDIEENTLATGSMLYKFYSNLDMSVDVIANHVYKQFSDYPRAKLLPVTEFTSDKSWILENWFDDKELQKIGASKAVEYITLKDYIAETKMLLNRCCEIEKELGL